MKCGGILNPELAWLISSLGHKDMIVISNASLPIPEQPARIDLAVAPNIPRFIDVLKVVLNEVVVEKAVIESEMRSKSPALHGKLKGLLGEVPVEEVPHEEFKGLIERARGVVRTGEFTPYANIILVSGVPF